MNILHVINNLDKGGAERLLVNFLPELQNEKYKITLLQLNATKSEHEYIQSLNDKGIVTKSLNNNLSIYSPKNINLLVNFLKENSFDIVHAHLFPTMYWIAFAVRKLKKSKRPKLIFTEHSIQNRRFNNIIFRPIDRYVYSIYDGVVAISPNIKSKLDQWNSNPSKNFVIRNGISIKSINQTPNYDSATLSSKLNSPLFAFTIMMTARFHYPKKQILLIQTLPYLPEDVVLIFAGAGEGMKEAQELAKSLHLNHRVFFLGFRNDVTQLMKSVDINILATEYEGMSGVTLEALSANKPFLGSNVPGVNDVVPNQSFCFENNIEDLSLKIKTLYDSSDLRNENANVGKKFAQQFDLSNMIDQHIKLYLEILK